MVQNQYQLAENDPPNVLFHADESYSRPFPVRERFCDFLLSQN
jgi:hypothetical protein